MHPGHRSQLATPSRAAVAALIAAALVAPSAAAQGRPQAKDRAAPGNGDGVDAHLFRPPVDSKGFLSVNGADILGHKDLSLGLVIDYGHRLMKLAPGHGAKAMVEHAFQGTFQFDVGLANWLVLGVSAPVVLNNGDTATDIGKTGATYDDDALDAQTVGHIAAHAKLRLLRPEGPLGVALIAQAGYGFGQPQNFGSEPGFWYWPQAVVERRFGDTGVFRLALNVGYRGHTGKNPVFGLGADGQPQLDRGVFEYANLGTGGFAMSLRALPALDLVAETYATYALGGSSDAKQRLSAEALGGFKIFVEKSSFLYVGGGAAYLPGFQGAAQRAVLGFMFEPSIGDRDGDGIKDDEDDCPDDPEDYDGFQDTKSDSPPGKYGCPDPDNDNDGIPDVRDRCPNDPEDFDGDHDSDGCPEASDGDRDGDGILDSRDKCPDEPEDRDGFEDDDGCPEPDNDQDGIPDTLDACPNDPEDKDGFEDTDGCPDPDNDKDGIPDAVDQCPNDPETWNGLDDEDGCPDKGKVVIRGNDILIFEKILFKTGSAEILPASFGIVDAVAQTLLHHPEFTLIEVDGHADERGDATMNLRLTEDRARAVVEALAKRGVERQRLHSMGYGEYCPVDPAHSAAAWEKNRRVEFKVVQSKDGPTGVELGCAKAAEKGIKPPSP
jgi:outer membrane protein OmpA-like peptidoglycan-associated protein